MPPDIMIEKWIYDSYPALRPLQLKSIQKQLAESVAGLSDTVQRITPPTIVNASNLMNYVFFRLLGNHFGINFVKPYSTTQYINKGKELALITENEYVNSYEGDIKMINRWAEFLSLSRWFSWTDFESVPENYLAND